MEKQDELDIGAFWVASGEDLKQDAFPRLDNISAAFLYRFVPRPLRLSQPEFVYVPGFHKETLGDDYSTKALVAISEWNTLWEAGQLRTEMLPNWDRFPAELHWLRKYKNRNLYLIPGGPIAPYEAYSPIYHLLPLGVLERYGLPAFKRGLWPPIAVPNYSIGKYIDNSFGDRLARAFGSYIWRLLDSGSPISAFSSSYPLRLLAHNLDFWLPFAVKAIERRLKVFPFAPFDDENQRKDLNAWRKKAPSYVRAGRPRCGGTVWCGEKEAWDMAEEIVEVADRRGKLRAIIDAIRSNRVEDDFSPLWSYAKEDFERKLYHKRSKIKITFVELNEAIPVHGPASEVHENLLWADFIALLDEKERHIVICLSNGISKLGDIAKGLGYSSHSPISKALSKIRQKAKGYLNLN